MKKLIFCVFISLITYTALAQEYGWTDISANLPEYSVYNDVYFIGDEGWITGWNDGLIYTPDGGETFQIQVLPENSGISSSIFMTNNQEGYVVTYSGNILKTDDGGTNWSMLHGPGGTLNSIHFPPTLDIGYTCGNYGNIYAFTDSSFVDMTVDGLTATLQSIFFPVNSSEGKLCGNSTIRRWLNSTWDNLQILDNTYFYNSIFFTDNNTGWVVGSLGKIFKTTDATIWNGQISGTSNSLNDVFFIDSLEGWAAGSEVLLHTVDGGITWTQELASQTGGMELTAIYFTSGNNGYIVGNTLLKYGEITSSESDEIPVQILLLQNYPNPFNPETEISFHLSESYNVSLSIYNVKGQKINTLLNEQRQAGEHSFVWDGKDTLGKPVSSGVYLYKLRVNDKTEAVKKCLLMK